MEEKLLTDNCSDKNKNEKAAVAHIKSSDFTLKTHSPGEYNKPEREAKTWCSYMEREFRASRNLIKEHTDTQINPKNNTTE